MEFLFKTAIAFYLLSSPDIKEDFIFPNELIYELSVVCNVLEIYENLHENEWFVKSDFRPLRSMYAASKYWPKLWELSRFENFNQIEEKLKINYDYYKYLSQLYDITPEWNKWFISLIKDDNAEIATILHYIRNAHTQYLGFYERRENLDYIAKNYPFIWVTGQLPSPIPIWSLPRR